MRFLRDEFCAVIFGETNHPGFFSTSDNTKPHNQSFKSYSRGGGGQKKSHAAGQHVLRGVRGAVLALVVRQSNTTFNLLHRRIRVRICEGDGAPRDIVPEGACLTTKLQNPSNVEVWEVGVGWGGVGWSEVEWGKVGRGGCVLGDELTARPVSGSAKAMVPPMQLCPRAHSNLYSTTRPSTLNLTLLKH